MWGKPGVEVSSRALQIRDKTIHLDLLVGTDWPVGNSKKTGAVAVRRASEKTRRDRNEVRGQAGFGSGACCFITPFGASWTVGPTVVPESVGPFSVGRYRGAS